MQCTTVSDAFREVFDLVRRDSCRFDSFDSVKKQARRSMQMKFKMLLAVALGMMCDICFASVSIDPVARTFTKTGGAGTVLTSGSGTWTATTDSDWIAIKPRTSGDAGVSCVYVVSKKSTMQFLHQLLSTTRRSYQPYLLHIHKSPKSHHTPSV